MRLALWMCVWVRSQAKALCLAPSGMLCLCCTGMLAQPHVLLPSLCALPPSRRAKESARAQQVVQHPLYKLDPIQAISNHLNATLPAAPAPKAARAADKGKRPRKKKKGGKGEMDTAE